MLHFAVICNYISNYTAAGFFVYPDNMLYIDCLCGALKIIQKFPSIKWSG